LVDDVANQLKKKAMLDLDLLKYIDESKMAWAGLRDVFKAFLLRYPPASRHRSTIRFEGTSLSLSLSPNW